MPQDYEIASAHVYNNVNGFDVIGQNFAPGTNFIGGLATNDGNWNLTDLFSDVSSSLYQGHYFADGHMFLVFTGGSATQVVSPTAGAGSPGYPSDYLTDPHPALITTPLATCFAAGTSIACPDGARDVETLQIGDKVLTAAGKISIIRWIGRQTLDMRLQDAGRNCPVCIRTGAFGDGLPHSDLTVTANHGMVLDGLVINAGALVNGTTIDWVPMADLPDCFTVYHIETEAHDVILANGAPAETFVDVAGRMAFDNHAEYLDLYGVERIIPEMEWPRIASQRLLPQAIRQKLRIEHDEVEMDQPLSA